MIIRSCPWCGLCFRRAQFSVALLALQEILANFLDLLTFRSQLQRQMVICLGGCFVGDGVIATSTYGVSAGVTIEIDGAPVACAVVDAAAVCAALRMRRAPCTPCTPTAPGAVAAGALPSLAEPLPPAAVCWYLEGKSEALVPSSSAARATTSSSEEGAV